MLARIRARTERPEYCPRGAPLALRGVTAPECVLAGPAGTGKTRGCLEWLHRLALNYPRSRGLLCRSERNALTQTALVTFAKEVRPELDGVVWRATEQEYRYPNGSVVVVAGLDHEGQKVFSGQYDHIYVNEATEIAEAHWENLTTRLRGGKSPLPLVFGDCNPDRPTHWLKARCDRGQTLLLESRHEDNPILWDADAGDWTAEGRRYVLGVLGSLSGPRLDRLRYGRWVAAEGLVYESFDAAVHLVNRSPIPTDWPRYWAVDFGYTNPFVCQFWAKDPDGRLYLYRELYHTARLVEDHATRLKQLLSQGEPRPRAVVCDHDAEDRATLERHLGIKTTAADKAVSPGIQAVASRLRPAGDGRPRLFLLRDATDERDPALSAAKKPQGTVEELDGYCWDTRGGRRKGEVPVDRDDHGMDAMRYVVAFLDGRPQPGRIEPPGRDNRAAALKLPEGVFG